MSLVRDAWLIARKDFQVEVRSRELIYTTLFFAIASVLVFAFAFVDPNRQPGSAGQPPADSPAAGVLWVAIAFSGTLALGRAFERERQSETLRALLLAPIERASVYLGKFVALLVLMALTELLVLPAIGLLFHAPLGRAPLVLAGIMAAGSIGFAGVGTLFAAMLVRAQSRDVLLPVVLYPLTIPVIILSVQGTHALFAPEADVALAENALAILVFFDAVFVTLALWTFGLVMRD